MEDAFGALKARVQKFDPKEISQRVIERKEASKNAFLSAMEVLGKDNFSSRHPVGHFTVSILLVSNDHDSCDEKLLVNYHKVDQSLTWFGGHGDGCLVPETQIIKEVQEECGFEPDKFEILSEKGEFVPAVQYFLDGSLNAKIMAVSTFAIAAHVKRGQEVAPHIHYDVAFVGRASSSNPGRVKPDENSFVGWKTMQQLDYGMADREKYEIFKDVIGFLRTQEK